MKTKINRRNFLIRGSQAGLACCVLLSGKNLLAGKNFIMQQDDKKIPNPKDLCYCGYKCPPDCKFLKASIKNDVELKKEAYKEWKIKEQYNIDFDPEKIFCFGCKNKENEEGVVLKKCTVRSCAISKGIECCIECNELVDCEKDLWTRFPNFKKMVIDMQKKYQETSNKG